MSSNLLNTLNTLRANLHNVGNLNNWTKKIVNQGAVVDTANIDNFELVELGFNAAGERICKSLTANNKKGYLVATPEDYVKEFETISSFFNAVGEMARVVALESGMRFECSNIAFAQADLVTHPLKNGMNAHYDAAQKKILLSNDNAGGNHGDYANATNKFILVEKDCVSIDGQKVYRFEVL